MTGYRDWRLVAKLFAALGAIEGSAQLLGHYIVCTLARRGTPTRPQSHEAGGSHVCMAHEVFPRARAESGGGDVTNGMGGVEVVPPASPREAADGAEDGARESDGASVAVFIAG